jgi:DNA-binding XRE family transcriptional regulator
MRVTTHHPSSSYGVPVILADDGSVMDYGPGVKAIREKAGMTTEQLANKIGVSRRTVEGWEQGRPISTPAIKLLATLLKK